jgi:hypothetical protein
MKTIKLLLLITILLIGTTAFSQPLFKGKDSILISNFLTIYEDSKFDFDGNIGKEFKQTEFHEQLCLYKHTIGCTEMMSIQNGHQLFYNFKIKFVGKQQEEKAKVLLRFLTFLQIELEKENYVIEKIGDFKYITNPDGVTILVYSIIDEKLVELQIRSSGEQQLARNKKYHAGK